MYQEIELSHEQLAPVYSDAQINVTLSVPGSGKTTVLVERAKRLRRQTSEDILALTFSRRAAADIEKRIGSDPNIKVSTIHGFCFGIIRENWEQLGKLLGVQRWPDTPVVCDERQELKLLSELFPTSDTKRMLDTFRELRKLGTDPQTLAGLVRGGVYLRVSKELISQWSEYEQRKLAQGLLTYEDMATLAEILLPLPDVSTSLSNRYPHILIDEAQDTSHIQWRIIRTLVANAKTTLAVGDLNQSIYGWRDADGTILKRLGEQESAAVFHLRRSYRSKGLITKLANLICPDRKSKIEGHTDSGTLDVRRYSSEAEEVQAVVSSLEGNCAILSRTNAYLESFERELIKRGIPYKGAAFYRSPHIRALASFVKRVSGDHVDAASRAFLKNEDYSKVEKEDFKLALRVIKEQGAPFFLDLVEGATTEGEGVTLMTGHGAKGLEWDRVWVVGVTEGRIPHSKSTDPQEESRLLYVMITRAREALHLSYVGTPSSLLPKEILEIKSR